MDQFKFVVIHLNTPPRAYRAVFPNQDGTVVGPAKRVMVFYEKCLDDNLRCFGSGGAVDAARRCGSTGRIARTTQCLGSEPLLVDYYNNAGGSAFSCYAHVPLMLCCWWCWVTF